MLLVYYYLGALPGHPGQMTEVKKESAKAQCWVMTIFCNEKYPEIEMRIEQIKRMPDWVKHVRYGIEHTQEGKVHLQCYCQCWNPVRFTQFKAWIGDSFREPMYGRLLDNDDYTSKEGNYTDLGDRPMQGRRTDIIGTKRRLDQIEDGQSIYDIANDEPHFAAIMKCSKTMQEYVNHNRLKRLKTDFEKPEVIYITGKSGCGKDKYVDEHYPGVYDVPADDGYKWKNGYNLDHCVVYRNIRPHSIKDKAQFLKELDRRVCQVPTKGGFVPWKPKVILLTSVFSVEVFAQLFDEPDEFKRRITAVINLNSI